MPLVVLPAGGEGEHSADDAEFAKAVGVRWFCCIVLARACLIHSDEVFGLAGRWTFTIQRSADKADHANVQYLPKYAEFDKNRMNKMVCVSSC